MPRNTLRWTLLAIGAAAAVCCVLAVSPRLRADESLAQRRARVQTMARAEKEEIERRQTRFAGLDETEQDRLRRLHKQLEQTENREELRRLMHRYCRWLATLSSYERAELAELPPAERIEQVKKLLADSERKGERRSFGDFPWFDRGRPVTGQGFDPWKRPSPEDFKAIHEWFNRYLDKQMPELIARLPEPRRQKAEKAIQSADDPSRRHERLAVVWLQGLMQEPNQVPPPDEAALEELRKRLSPEMRQRLESLPTNEQWRIMIGWLRFLAAYRAGDRWRPDPVLPVVEDKELARFLEENLTSEQRDRILNLPSDEMRRELRQEYLRWRLQDESLRWPSRRGWNRGGPGGPPHSGHSRPEERFPERPR